MIEKPPPPRKRRKEARPAELIEAGLVEFAAHGYAATRLEDVASRAAVSKGTIYRYFTDKEALFIAAVQSRISPALGDMGALLAGFDGTTEELLTVLVRTLHARLVNGDARVLLRILVGEGGRFPDLIRHYHAQVVQKARPLLAAIMKRGIERQEVAAGAVAACPEALLGPVIMAVMWKLTFDAIDPIDASRFEAAHLELIRAWLKASSSAY